MPVTTPATTQDARSGRGDGIGIDGVTSRLGALLGQLTAVEQERVHREREWREARTTLLGEGERARKALEEELGAPAAPLDAEKAHAQMQAARAGWLKRVADGATRQRKLLRQAYEREVAALKDRQLPNVPLALTDQDRALIQQRKKAFQKEIAALRERASEIESSYLECCRQLGIRPVRADVNASAQPLSPLPEWDLARLIALVRQELEAAAAMLDTIHDRPGYAACLLPGIIGRHCVLGVVPMFAVAIVVWIAPYPPAVVPLVVGGAVLQLLAMFYTAIRRWSVSRDLRSKQRAIAQLDARVGMLADSGVRELDSGLPFQQQLARLDHDDLPQRQQALKAACDQEIAEVRSREQDLGRRVAQRYSRTLSSLKDEAQQAVQLKSAQDAGRRSTLQSDLQQRLEALDGSWQGTLEQLTKRWQDAERQLFAFGATILAEAERRQPAWTATSWSSWSPPTSPGSDILIGRIRSPREALLADAGIRSFPSAVAVTALQLPLALAFPQPSSLLIRSGTACRSQSLALINQLVLRALTSLPAGQLHLTIIDPVGLGDSFAGLLEVADHDEALLGSGILSDQPRIERGLEDQVAHLEVVIQKHLRGRYATIADYNREAGEMQEPLRLVVVADFPASFSERALEHLGVLARSGTRCGVHLVVLHDDRKPVPPALDLATFRRTGLVLREVQGRLAVDREALHAWELEVEPLAPPTLRSALISTIGQGATRAKRIEVPFSAVGASGEKRWTLSSAKSLSIPIGKRGADRLQFLELGRGTCQHALIGGRTGSGKSTLFHVLVTSAALWYHPRELQFHLIDFKKGVEFKAFATHRLPHAQVIAIESDREFGLNVLRHLDQELTRRGESFRRAGAHDLAGHRAAGGEHLPRLLLLIDEFQEFFTEDDVIARDAALLLDRFVRQGRAFGLHVILGSQTLGGSYALAKSSLGQMGVRIALPCNEADAHLLLNENNDAARLLTRPGDGIYNDQAGLAEGNSPFQVCWLPEEEEGANLAAIAAMAVAENWKPARPPVLFEGNGPSRLEDDGALAGLLDGKPAPTPALRASIGQSSSLDGSAEAFFPAAAGGNLLILGQNREAAAATCGAILLGLMARNPPRGIRLLAIDGEDASGTFAAMHQRFTQTLPHGWTRSEGRDAGKLVAELAALLERRSSGEDEDRTPVVLTVFALQRLRQLRPDEEIAFGKSGEPPAEAFARLLANGAEYGIHLLVWCDSLASAQRGMSRRSLKDFDRRILFQMSGADSSELIEDDGASRLGLHTALLSALMDGRLDKFRPFALPEQAFLERLGVQLSRRFGPPA